MAGCTSTIRDKHSEVGPTDSKGVRDTNADREVEVRHGAAHRRRRLGWTVNIENRAVEEWAAGVARQARFSEVSHTVGRFGRRHRYVRKT